MPRLRSNGARTIAVKPLADEFQLRMNDMIESNRKEGGCGDERARGLCYIPNGRRRPE